MRRSFIYLCNHEVYARQYVSYLFACHQIRNALEMIHRGENVRFEVSNNCGFGVTYSCLFLSARTCRD